MACLLWATISLAQTNVELQVENINGKQEITLNLKQNIDNKTVVTRKTYQSMEELRNDPDLKDIDVHILADGEAEFIGSNDFNVVLSALGDSTIHKVMVETEDINNGFNQSMKMWTDEEGRVHVIKNGQEVNTAELKNGNDMFFWNTNGEKNVNIEVKIDDNGTRHVYKNGVELSEVEMAHDVTLSDTTEDMNIEVTIDEAGQKHVTVNGQTVNYDEWIKNNKSGTFEAEVTTNNQGQKTVVLVEQLHIKVTEINEKEEASFGIENTKELKPNTLNYYPNPSNGKFTLTFKGKAKPTTIRITNTQGKTVYEKTLHGFDGSFSNEIDIRNLPKGIYLLQVIQGSKAAHKKLIIE